MAETDSVRIELAFEGGQIIAASWRRRPPTRSSARSGASSQGTLQLDTDDGRLTVVLPQVVYAKRFARESSVGFGL